MLKKNLKIDIYSLHQPAIYAWARGDEILYIGLATDLMRRLGSHNVIGRQEPVKPGDLILILEPATNLTGKQRAILERQLIRKHRPRLNRVFNPTHLKVRSVLPSQEAQELSEALKENTEIQASNWNLHSLARTKRAIYLREDGWTLDEIADELGVGIGMVLRMISGYVQPYKYLKLSLKRPRVVKAISRQEN